MNRSPRAIPRFQILTACTVFIAVVLLAFHIREQLIEVVLVPVLYVFWVVEIVLKSFDQRCIWGLTVVISLVLSLFLTRRKQRNWFTRPMKVQPAPQGTGRIDFWRSQIRMRGLEGARSFRRAELRRLLIGALAYRESKNIDEILTQLHAGQIRVPPEVGYILNVGNLHSVSARPTGFIRFIKQQLMRFIPRLRAPKSSSDPQLETVAIYLEQLMEVDHDNQNR